MTPVRDDETDFQEVRDKLHLQMMSAVSHDLKTPLASIIGSLDIFTKMRHQLSPEKQEELLQTAIQEAYRLDGFISNILDMARLENGMVKVSNTHCNIGQLVQDNILKLGQRAADVNISFSVPETEIVCDTDPALLGRALQCLLDNALKYTRKPDAHIDLDCEERDGWVHIHVRDNGPGIAIEDHEKIFCKYTRVYRADYQNAGTGLGLTLCSKIMRLLGGSVEINPQSAAKSGAWFTLSLACCCPIRQVD